MVKRGQKERGSSVYRNPMIFSGGRIEHAKKRTLPSIPIKYVLLGIILFVLIFFLFFSSQFQVKDVIVEGTNLVPADQIAALIPKGDNIFRLNTSQIEQDILNKFPEVKSVDIYRGIPNAIKAVVLERDGKLVWQSGENKYLVSSQGEVARLITGEEGKDLPLVIDKKNVPVTTKETLVSPNFIAFIYNIWNGISDTVNIKPVNFSVNETTFDVDLLTDGGFYVKFNSLRSSKKQLDSLKKVVVEKRPDIHEYVDLRVDGWAYYK